MTLIFTNGRVFTADPSQPFVGAVAVADGRVVALGDEAEALTGVDRFDLDGRMMTPGFIDAHVHPATSGLDKLRIDFEGVKTAEEAFEAITAHAIANPDESWILGAGWSQGWFDRGCPDREILDRLVPDRPVLLWNTDGHGAWVNSVALDRAVVDATTP